MSTSQSKKLHLSKFTPNKRINLVGRGLRRGSRMRGTGSALAVRSTEFY
jgi:hypothetical protein